MSTNALQRLGPIPYHWHPKAVHRVAEDTPENRAQLENLTGLVRLGTLASGLRSFALRYIHIQGLWPLTGATTFGEWGRNEFGVSERTVKRMMRDGIAAWELISGTVGKELVPILHDGAKMAPWISGLAIRKDIPRLVSDAHGLRALSVAAPGKRVQVAEEAAAAGVDDDPAAIREIAKKYKPPPKPPPKGKAKSKPRNLPSSADMARALVAVSKTALELARRTDPENWTAECQKQLETTCDALRVVRDQMKRLVP